MLIRFSIASFAGLFVCGTVLASGEPKGQSGDEVSSAMAEQVAEIDKGITEAQKKAQAAQMQLMLYQNTNKKKLEALINDNPNDPAVADAAMLLVEKFRAP